MAPDGGTSPSWLLHKLGFKVEKLSEWSLKLLGVGVREWDIESEPIPAPGSEHGRVGVDHGVSPPASITPKDKIPLVQTQASSYRVPDYDELVCNVDETVLVLGKHVRPEPMMSTASTWRAFRGSYFCIPSCLQITGNDCESVVIGDCIDTPGVGSEPTPKGGMYQWIMPQARVNFGQLPNPDNINARAATAYDDYITEVLLGAEVRLDINILPKRNTVGLRDRVLIKLRAMKGYGGVTGRNTVHSPSNRLTPEAHLTPQRTRTPIKSASPKTPPGTRPSVGILLKAKARRRRGMKGVGVGRASLDPRQYADGGDPLHAQDEYEQGAGSRLGDATEWITVKGYGWIINFEQRGGPKVDTRRLSECESPAAVINYFRGWRRKLTKNPSTWRVLYAVPESTISAREVLPRPPTGAVLSRRGAEDPDVLFSHSAAEWGSPPLSPSSPNMPPMAAISPTTKFLSEKKWTDQAEVPEGFKRLAICCTLRVPLSGTDGLLDLLNTQSKDGRDGMDDNVDTNNFKLKALPQSSLRRSNTKEACFS
jgi:hypothetical protein